jgi:hypothetical protein
MYNATIIEIFIASPSDVVHFRKTVRETIREWNYSNSRARSRVLMPTGWETHGLPLAGVEPQQNIDENILDHADVLIAIFWTTPGTKTPNAEGATLEEIQHHLDSGKPALLYFCKETFPHKVDLDAVARVREAQKAFRDSALYHEFTTSDDLRRGLRNHLDQVVNNLNIDIQHSYEIEPITKDENKLTELELEIMMLMSQDTRGSLRQLTLRRGDQFQSNQTVVNSEFSGKEKARIKDALERLIELEYIEWDKYINNGKGELFKMTKTGYDFLES